MIQIANNQIKAEILKKGAELASLVDIQSGKEWMWSADPAYWGKSSPILFPIVGALKDNTYLFDGKSYSLPRHGFARDMEFEVRELKSDRVTFGLKSSNETLNIYPFDFDLEVEYSVSGTILNTEYRVKNLSDSNPMWFSLGAHPAFAVETNKEKTFSDYQLHFENDEFLNLYPIQNNLILKETNQMPLDKGNLALSYPLFFKDALVMTDLKSRKIELCNRIDRQSLQFSFSNFPHLGIWSAKNADFVCLEPWSGIADFVDHNQDLKQKFGINQLAPLDIWSARWKVII